MLKEGVVEIPPAEEKAIDGFLKEIEKAYNKRRRIHKNSSDMAISAALRDYANSIAPKFGLNRVTWRFIYDPNSTDKAGYVPNYDEIFVNLAYVVPKRWEPLQDQKVNFKDVAQHVYHEWVHLKQDDIIKKTNPKGMMAPALKKMYMNTPYSDIKWEHMALARGELEWIKRNIKRTNPLHMIKWIQKQGLLSPEAKELKYLNRKAYKNVLKYAIMFALKKMAQKALKK